MFEQIEAQVREGVEWLRLLVETLGALVIAAGVVIVVAGLAHHLLSQRDGSFSPIRLAFAAGILIGNRGRRKGMSDATREQVGHFWELLDSILNAALFVLIGFEALLLPFSSMLFAAGLLAVGRTAGGAARQAVRLARGCLAGPHLGGLRGGISVALALSLPAGPERNTLVTITYIVVVFSIMVQGLSVEKLVRRLVPCVARKPVD